MVLWLFLQVERDGVTFSPGSKEIDLIQGDFPRGLDNGIMEAPWIIYREPFYYLFYSTSFYFNPHYNVKVARSLHVTGPYFKHPSYVLKVDGFKLEHGTTKFVGTGKISKPRIYKSKKKIDILSEIFSQFKQVEKWSYSFVHNNRG